MRWLTVISDDVAGGVLHFLWQGAVVYLLTHLVLWMCRGGSASARYVIAYGGLLVMMACPVVTVAWSMSWGGGGTAVEWGLGRRYAGVALHHALSLGYVVGVGVMLLRLVMRVRGGRLLKYSSRPVLDPELLHAIARQSRRMGLKLTPAIGVCESIAVPCVVGVLRPLLLVPLDFTLTMKPREVAWVIAHELGHIRRLDHVFNFAQGIIETLLFFHPCVWRLSRVIHAERECSCDDMAVRRRQARVEYGSMLLGIAGRLDEEAARMVGVSLAGTGRESYVRIGRLLLTRHEATFRLKSFTPLVVFVMLMLGVIGTARGLSVSTPPGATPVVAWDVNPNAVDETGLTRLHHAAGRMDLKLVKALLDAGADPNLTAGEFKRTPLMLGFGRGARGIPKQTPRDEQLLELVRLLAPRTKVMTDRFGHTALHLAAWGGHVRTAEYLLSLGYKPSQAKNGDTPLHLVRADHDHRLVHLLVNAGNLLTDQGNSGSTAAESIVYSSVDVSPTQRQAMLDVFESQGLRIDAWMAIVSSDMSRFERAYQEDPTCVLRRGPRAAQQFTLLQWAVIRNDERMVERLLSLGATLEAVDTPGSSIIVFAARVDRSGRILRQLLSYEAGQSLVLMDRSSVGPLHSAAEFGNFNAMAVLIEAGERVDQLDSDGLSPLHLACEAKFSPTPESVQKTVRLLIESGADANLKSPKSGRTPLHYAMASREALALKSVSELFSAGVDLTVPDTNGSSIQDMAIASGSLKLMEMVEAELRRRGGASGK